MENFKPDIDKALEVLRAGGIILYPTDTVWGIGCDATNETAVAKIFNLKNRAEQQSMLILTDNINRISTYADDVPDVALDLMEIADQPTTVIFSNAKNIAKNLIAPDGSVGIRIPDDTFCQQLLERFKKPIVSTSANISGQPTPKFFSEISEHVKSGVDYVVSWRQNERKQAKASGIIKITPDSTITIIRK
jgi:L-threonylcarbamoyladenylate synthase